MKKISGSDKKGTKGSQASYRPTMADLFDLAPRKSELQKMKIVEAAIRSYGMKGISETSNASLAVDCGISRSLIHHYFPDPNQLLLLAAQYARQTLLRLAVEGMAVGLEKQDPRRMLQGYVEGCLKWLQLFPEQARFWLIYYHQTSLHDAALNENSKLVKQGHQRIAGIIQLGQQQKLWSVKEPQAVAKQIQLVIGGLLIARITETGYLTEQNALSITTDAIFALLGRSL